MQTSLDGLVKSTKESLDGVKDSWNPVDMFTASFLKSVLSSAKLASDSNLKLIEFMESQTIFYNDEQTRINKAFGQIISTIKVMNDKPRPDGMCFEPLYYTDPEFMLFA